MGRTQETGVSQKTCQLMNDYVSRGLEAELEKQKFRLGLFYRED